MNNPNFYSYGNNFTFQNNILPPNYTVPPPPIPPVFMPPIPQPPLTDQELVRQFEKLSPQKKTGPKSKSITVVKQKLCDLVQSLNNLKEKQKFLAESIDVLSDKQWMSKVQETEKLKLQINIILSSINDTYLNTLQKLLSKRSAKRLRQKKLRTEKKRERELRIKELKERSRKIDENLQKIQDGINKLKQEEQSKLEADLILKDVLRKKQDAKKYITKLDALVKLRRARENTAKGRGEDVSERDAASFNSNIEKLKSLWAQRLSTYEREEIELRAKLKQAKQDMSNDKEQAVLGNLAKWREFLFGGDLLPQRDLRGDVQEFVAIRSKWDQFVDAEGSALPIGWVLPQ